MCWYQQTIILHLYNELMWLICGILFTLNVLIFKNKKLNNLKKIQQPDVIWKWRYYSVWWIMNKLNFTTKWLQKVWRHYDYQFQIPVCDRLPKTFTPKHKPNHFQEIQFRRSPNPQNFDIYSNLISWTILSNIS